MKDSKYYLADVMVNLINLVKASPICSARLLD